MEVQKTIKTKNKKKSTSIQKEKKNYQFRSQNTQRNYIEKTFR